MRIDEFHQMSDKGVNFDIVEDAVIFMRNDPQFYRSQYFPAITHLADLHRAGKPYKASEIINPMIEKGCGAYTKQYNIANSPEEVFSEIDRRNILQKIYDEEIKQIKAGEYK